MATVSDFDGSRKRQRVSPVYGYIFSLNRNGNGSRSSENRTNNDLSRSSVHHIAPFCKKLNLVQKFPKGQFSLERNQNFSMKSTDSEYNVDDVGDSHESHYSTEQYERDYVDRDNLELMKTIATSRSLTGSKPTFLQTKRIQQLQQEEMYWRMPAVDKVINRNTFSERPFHKTAADKVINRNTFSGRPFHKTAANKKLNSTKSELTRNRYDNVPLQKNTLQNSNKLSENVLGLKKTFQRSRKSSLTDATLCNNNPAFKQHQDAQINNDYILKSEVGKRSVSQTSPNHLIDFTKYLEFTRPGWYSFDEDVVRTAGSSVDPIVLNSLDHRSLLGVSSSARLTGNQTSVLRLVNELNRTHSDIPVNRGTPVRHIDGNFYDISNFGASSASKVASTSPQQRDDISSSFHTRQTGKSVRYEVSGVISKKQESFLLGGNRNKGSKTGVNVPNVTKIKSEALKPVKQKTTVNYRTRSSQTVLTLDSPNVKVNSPKIKILTKPNTTKLPLRTTKSTNTLPKKPVRKKTVGTVTILETNKHTGGTQISRNSKPKLNLKSPTTPSKTKEKETITDAEVTYPTDAANLRKAAYQEYVQTGQRARFPRNVIEVVSYGQVTHTETENDVSHDFSNSSQQLALVEKSGKGHRKERVRNKKDAISLKKRRTKQPVVNPVCTANKYKLRTVKKDSASYDINKPNIFRNDSSQHKTDRTARRKGTRDLPPNAHSRVSKQKYGNIQRKTSGRNKQQSNAVVFIPCGEKYPKHLKSWKNNKIPSHICHRVTAPITESALTKKSDKLKTSRENKEKSQPVNTKINLNNQPLVLNRCKKIVTKKAKRKHNEPLVLNRCKKVVTKKPKRKHKEKRPRKNRFRTIRPLQRALIDFDGYNRRMRIRRKRSHSMQLSPIGLPWSGSDMTLKEDSATSEEEDSCLENSTHNYQSPLSSDYPIKQIERPFKNKFTHKKPGNKLTAGGEHEKISRRQIPHGNRRLVRGHYRNKLASKKTCSVAGDTLNQHTNREGTLNRRRRRRRGTLERKLAMITTSDCLKNNFIRYIYSLQKKYNSVPLNSPLDTASVVSIITDSEY